jgi:hypothetical protein
MVVEILIVEKYPLRRCFGGAAHCAHGDGTHSYYFHELITIVDGCTAKSCFGVASALDGRQQSVVTYRYGTTA